MAGGKVHRYQTERLHKDGTMIEVEITAFIQVDATGVDAGVTTITRDITNQNAPHTSWPRAKDATARCSTQHLTAFGDSTPMSRLTM